MQRVSVAMAGVVPLLSRFTDARACQCCAWWHAVSVVSRLGVCQNVCQNVCKFAIWGRRAGGPQIDVGGLGDGGGAAGDGSGGGGDGPLPSPNTANISALASAAAAAVTGSPSSSSAVRTPGHSRDNSRERCVDQDSFRNLFLMFCL